MKERDRALTGIARWQDALAAAEEKIQALRDTDGSDNATLLVEAPNGDVTVEPHGIRISAEDMAATQ